MSESTKKWYVVRTAGGKEKKAKEYIEKEGEALHLGHLITQVLSPTEKYYQVKNGKRVSAERIFYPGYVLVEAVMTGEIQHVVMKDAPKAPDTPDTPDTPQNTPQKTPDKPDTPKTGDESRPLLWASLMALALFGLIGSLVVMKKNKKNR